MNDNVSRSEYVKKNVLSGSLSNVIALILSFVSRTIFIYTLGATYLGVNGLFSNVLGLLSFTELGIGSAMNYSLYKPIAEGDNGKVISLMTLYRKSYRVIAITISLLGVALLPFIDRLVSAEAHFDRLKIYYLIFLFNTVSSYFVSYKYSYVNARQEGYIITNINIITNALIHVLQIAILILFKDFLIYLLIQSLLSITQKIVTNFVINKKYPILREQTNTPLPTEDRNRIKRDVKSLIIHKIGDASVHQTDNIIISVFSSTLSVGLVSNYVTLNNMVAGFTNTFFNSFTAGFGNMIAKESKEKQREILEVYNFVGYWIYGFVLIAFLTLTQPFIELWIGKEMQIDNLTMALYFISIYLAGQTFTIYNFKIAAGIFSEDKWFSFLQAIVNLVVSVIAVKRLGLPGVYIGTIVSRMIVVISRPYVVYRFHFGDSTRNYFLKFLYNSVTLVVTYVVMKGLSAFLLTKVNFLNFAILTIITAIIPNMLIYLFNFQRNEMKYLMDRFGKKLLHKKK